jgi:hypothetical protein
MSKHDSITWGNQILPSALHLYEQTQKLYKQQQKTISHTENLPFKFNVVNSISLNDNYLYHKNNIVNTVMHQGRYPEMQKEKYF